jgi:hypothetical protein
MGEDGFWVAAGASSFNTQRIDHLYRDRHDIENETSLAPHHFSLFLHYGERWWRMIWILPAGMLCLRLMGTS